MDPINQQGNNANPGMPPANPSMPPNNIPQQPAASGVPETPDAPLETEVNQFKPAEPAAAPTPEPTPDLQVSQPQTEFNAVPAQPTQTPEVGHDAPGTSPADAVLPPEPAAPAPVEPEPTIPVDNSMPENTAPVNPPAEPSTEAVPPTPPAPAEVAPEQMPEADSLSPAQEPVAPAPPPAVEQIGTLDQQPEMQNPAPVQPQSQFQTPTAPKKSKTGLIILIVLLVAALGGGAYYYLVVMKGSIPFISSSNSSTEDAAEEVVVTEPTPEQASSTSGADITTAYGKAAAISATSDKAKVVDVVISPVLNKAFSNNIKLIDASNMLSYLTNRAITATDVTSVKTQLEALGYKTADSTAKQLTMTKSGSTWVITFSVDTPTKAEIDVTY